ncbi:hypothetical protein K435DRAFT_589656, partial [Dendrothele bispora CBS 962.96]
AHPVLLLDILTATWLVDLPKRILLLFAEHKARRNFFHAPQALARHSDHVSEIMRKVDRKKQLDTLRYQRIHNATIQEFDFKPGELVLIRNPIIDKGVGGKMEPRYFGPMIIIRRTKGGRTKGGSYIVAEMNGAVYQSKIAAFRVVPYRSHYKLKLPSNLNDLIELSEHCLNEIE